MELRIGELLVEAGVLTEHEVDDILEQQRRSGEPFGLLSERLYNVGPEVIENAWARQYSLLTRTIDPGREVFDRRATAMVSRRQAWQFRVLPVRFDDVELMMATTQPHLRKALGFAINVIGVPTYLVLAEPRMLGESLCEHYDMPGMTARSVMDNGLDRLLSLVRPDRPDRRHHAA